MSRVTNDTDKAEKKCQSVLKSDKKKKEKKLRERLLQFSLRYTKEQKGNFNCRQKFIRAYVSRATSHFISHVILLCCFLFAIDFVQTQHITEV